MTSEPGNLEAAIIEPHPFDGDRVIDEFGVGDHDLVLERTGRADTVVLSLAGPDSLLEPVALIRFDPGTGRITGHEWCHSGERLAPEPLAHWVESAGPSLARLTSHLAAAARVGEDGGAEEYARRMRDLIELRRPVPEAAAALDQLAPREDRSFAVSAAHFVAAMERYGTDGLSTSDLCLWTETLYFHPDVVIEGDWDYVFEAVFFSLGAAAEPYDSSECDRALIPPAIDQADAERPTPSYRHPAVAGGGGGLGWWAIQDLALAWDTPVWACMIIGVIAAHLADVGVHWGLYGLGPAACRAVREAPLSIGVAVTALIAGVLS